MSPKIGFDIRMINYSGIGTTISGFLDHLNKKKLDQMVLLGENKERKRYPEASFVPTPDRVYGLTQHFRYGRLLNRQDLSLFHMPHYDVPLSYRGTLVATVHDLIHYLHPEWSTKPFTRAYSAYMLKRVARRASRIIAVSEHTRRDLIAHFPEAALKTVVIPLAAEAQYRPLPPKETQAVLRKHRLDKGYFLYVGNLRPSKNTVALVRGYTRVTLERRDLPSLVLVGRNSYKNVDLEKYGIGVRCLGTVPKDHLPALYNGASAFVFPSLYEGFGLPPLEAMACGAPVLSSRSASLPEVCGEAAHYLEENSVDGIARGLIEIWKSEPLRKQLREKGLARAKQFSWKNFADATWAVYEDVLREKPE